MRCRKRKGNTRKRPQLYVIAGPNGAGKTTFATRFLPAYANCVEFVNTDLIAAGLSPFDPDNVAVAAGRVMLSRVLALAGKRVSFALESTLSGRWYLGFFRRLKKGGYTITVLYLWIPVVELGLRRIQERVKAGGHNVPAHVVARRFHRSLRNLFGLYWTVADNVLLFDNSGLTPQLIATKRGGRLLVSNRELFKRIKGMIEDEKEK